MKPSFHSRFLNPFLRSVLLTAATLAPGIVGTAQATIYTWNGATDNWGSTNWNPGPVTGPTLAADSAVINSGTVTLTSNNLINNLGAVTIGAGGKLTQTTGNGWNQLNNLTMQGGTLESAAGTLSSYGCYYLPGTVTVSGSFASAFTSTGSAQFINLGVTGSSTGVTTFDVADVTGSTAADLTVSTRLANAPDNSNLAAGLTKTGAGTMVLSNYNTYTGGTTVNQGALELNVGGAGTGAIRGTLTINSGATVKLNAVNALGYNPGVSVTQINIDGGTLDNAVNDNNSARASWTLTGGTMTSSGGGAFHINYDSSGGNSITSKASANSSVISARITLRDNTVTSINVEDGAAATDLLISGAIGQWPGTACGISKTGAGTLKLTSNESYTGATVVNQGILELAAANAPSAGLFTSSSITINNGGQILVSQWNALHGYSSSGVGKLTINAGGSMTMTNGATAHIRGALELNGGTLASGTPEGTYGSWSIDGDVTATGTTASTMSASQMNWTGTRTFTVSDVAGNLNVTGTFAYPSAWSGALTKAGEGTMTLSSTNTYTGATTVSSGTLKVSGSIATSDVTVNGGILASGSTGTVGKNVTVNSGATLAAGGVGAVGAASVASNLNFSSGSIFDWDLTTGAGNGTYDTVSVTSALNITSGAKFNVVSSTPFSDTFWDTTRTWSNIFGGKTIDNFLVTNFLYSGTATAPTAEGSFTVSGSSLTWTAVPEPTSTLAGFLLAAGLLRRRR